MVQLTFDEPLDMVVMRDQDRPCLFGVAGPCFHPACLEAHYMTLAALREEAKAKFRISR